MKTTHITGAVRRATQFGHMHSLQLLLNDALEACGLHFVVHDDPNHQPSPALHIYSSIQGRCLWLDQPFGRNLNEIHPVPTANGIHWMAGHTGELDHRETSTEAMVDFVLRKLAAGLAQAPKAWAQLPCPIMNRLYEYTQTEQRGDRA
jgi:hypothetical protein